MQFYAKKCNVLKKLTNDGFHLYPLNSEIIKELSRDYKIPPYQLGCQVPEDKNHQLMHYLKKQSKKKILIKRNIGMDCGAHNCFGRVPVLFEGFVQYERIILNFKCQKE